MMEIHPHLCRATILSAPTVASLDSERVHAKEMCFLRIFRHTWWLTPRKWLITWGHKQGTYGQCRVLLGQPTDELGRSTSSTAVSPTFGPFQALHFSVQKHPICSVVGFKTSNASPLGYIPVYDNSFTISYTLSVKVIHKHIDILYLCCSHAYFLDLVLVKHESHKSDTEPLKLHHVSSSKHHVSEPFAPQVLLIQIKKKHQIAAANSPTEPGGVGTPGNRGHLKKSR